MRRSLLLAARLARGGIRRAERAAPLMGSPSLALRGGGDDFRRMGAIWSTAAPLAVPAGDSGAVYHVQTEEAWFNKLSLLATEKNQPKLAVVDFTAAWCGPCKVVAPVFKELSKKYPEVLFLKVDVDELPSVTSEWKVHAMPTFIFIAGTKEVHRVVGADIKELEAKILELCGKSSR